MLDLGFCVRARNDLRGSSAALGRDFRTVYWSLCLKARVTQRGRSAGLRGRFGRPAARLALGGQIWRFQAPLEAARTARDDQFPLAACQEAAAPYLYLGPLADGGAFDWAEPSLNHVRAPYPAFSFAILAAAVLMPAGFFLSVIGRDPARPNRAIALYGPAPPPWPSG